MHSYQYIAKPKLIYVLIKFLLCFSLSSVFGAILIVCGLYTVVWGKSKDCPSTKDVGKGELSQELPIKDGTRSESDIFNGIEINVNPTDQKLKKLGAGKNAPPEA